MTRLFFTSFILLLFTLSLHANPNTKKEINHLLEYVKTTHCVYIRNGDKHKGPEAQSHIQRKYDYYVDDIEFTEDFIRLSATKSTMSGDIYQIKCPGEAKVPSAQWLLDELANFRKTLKEENK